MNEYLLEMKGIEKSFNGVSVLKGIDLHIKKGEIHALLGENGAGKSTLMNILGGLFPPDAGEICLEGKRVAVYSPSHSKSLGISFIHQELNVIGDLTVCENLFLGSEISARFGFLKANEMRKKAVELLERMGVSLDPDLYLRDLDASYKQIVEIAKALLLEAKIMIMDEPTTSLTEYEIDHLFTLMRSLKESGVSIIYISHKLKEVIQICDRYTVLRDGNRIETGEVAEVDEEHLTRLMVGKSLHDAHYYEERRTGAPVLQVTRLRSGKWVREVSFTLHQSEILGFTGLAGDGRTELFEAIFGYRDYAGEIRVNGREVKISHPINALKAGIGFLPKNRKENAIIKDLNILQNMSLSALKEYQKYGFIDRRREIKRFIEYRDKLNIKASDPTLPIESLSGGNQQKVVLAKWLDTDSKILIMDHPTQGIDVGAKSEIYHLIMELAKMGKSIIILSSEIPEILKLCDRVLVMYQGEITAELHRSEADEETIMLYATGAKREVPL